jgi:hypothetical protein
MKMEPHEMDSWMEFVIYAFGSEFLSGDEEFLLKLLERSYKIFKKSPLQSKNLLSRIHQWHKTLVAIDRSKYPFPFYSCDYW